MSDNDAVHVKFPVVCTARRLQGDALHFVCQQSARGPHTLTAAACLSILHSLLNRPGGMLSP